MGQGLQHSALRSIECLGNSSDTDRYDNRPPLFPLQPGCLALHTGTTMSVAAYSVCIISSLCCAVGSFVLHSAPRASRLLFRLSLD